MTNKDQETWIEFRDTALKKMPSREEVYASVDNDAKRACTILQVREAKLKAEWKAKNLSEDIN